MHPNQHITAPKQSTKPKTHRALRHSPGGEWHDYKLLAPSPVFLHVLRVFRENPAWCVALVRAEDDEEQKQLDALMEERKSILELSSVGTGTETRRQQLSMNRAKLSSSAFVKVANAVMLDWKNTPDFEVPGYGKIEFTFCVTGLHILRTYLNR
jgi:hypothetical protein